MKWCPNCNNYLYHNIFGSDTLTYICRKCNYSEVDKKGGLIVESRIQERASEGYKILVNEFTHLDPTLPHVKNIQCPNSQCPSNQGSEANQKQMRDVIYIKDDPVNLKYTYICTQCRTQWRSRS